MIVHTDWLGNAPITADSTTGDYQLTNDEKIDVNRFFRQSIQGDLDTLENNEKNY